MDILGIGPLELFFIVLIALIIFGPNDIVRAARTLGKFLRNVVSSDGWRAFQQASKGMKDLPTTLMREAGLDEEDLRDLTGINDLEKATEGFEHQISPWTTPPPKTSQTPANPANPWSTPGSSSIEAQPENGKQEKENRQQDPTTHPEGSPFSQNIDE